MSWWSGATRSQARSHARPDAAAGGTRMFAAGWPDERSIAGALVEPVEAIVVSRIFEALAAG
jgi:hypothetical protein